MRRYILFLIGLSLSIASLCKEIHSKRVEYFIKQQEGLSLSVYMDGQKKAVGYGHRIRKDDPKWLQEMEVGDTINAYIADLLFRRDMMTLVEPALRRIQRELSTPYPQSVYDTFASLIYNLGEHGLRRSQFFQLFYQKRYEESICMLPYTAIMNGPGLVRRRKREQLLLVSDFNFRSKSFIKKNYSHTSFGDS